MDRAADLALARMRADGAGPAALAAFARRLEALAAGPGAGLLEGSELEPVEDPPRLEDLPGDAGDVLRRTAVLKLNGGLGTSMGLRAPKSLIEVKPGHTFLDVIACQTRALGLALVLMNSAATRAASMAAAGGAARDFLQGREPRLWADSREPVSWPRDPALEWCPAGHGDVYVSLAESGMLATLRAEGIDWAFISNADNLGAVADGGIPAWAEAQGAPFVKEVVRGTSADRKGGHLARHHGRLVLRETAQVPEGDASFSDVERWRFYNTNNLWVDLRALDPAALDLPLIVNRKPVDPRDPASPEVLQLETAMGAAIGSIEGARAVHVPRARFAPVKTTDDLLVVRSDAYALRADGVLEPRFAGDPPVVALGPGYRRLDDFEARFGDRPPSLRGRSAFRVLRAFGPGRVNLIGEHTDYNGGLALPFAIEQGVTVEAMPVDGDEVVAVARDLADEDRFPAADPPRAEGWRAFVRGVVAELAPPEPVRLEISGDLPRGSGLSSSAALAAALCLALGAGDRDRVELARLCSRVENHWVGAHTGLLDQLASLLGREGHALRIDFRTLEVAPVPLHLGDWTLVVVDSGEAHSHAASGYNRRRAECAQACRTLGVETLSDAPDDARLPRALGRRLRHVRTENARVQDTIAALGAGDLAVVGALLDASHASLRDDYEASTDAVERTVAALRDAGAAGARMVGGGFGGHVLALLPPGAPTPAGASVGRPAPGARLLG
ncbi:MAG: UTP--glucose-1-phosphate uridylyltransferase [Solirubrobacteraceae bacterium]